MTLGKLLENLGSADNPDDVHYEEETEHDYYGDRIYNHSFFSINRLQSDDEYLPEVARYEKRLANYEKWYEENEEEIIEELARRKIDAGEKSKKDNEKAKRALQKQKKVLEKSLAYLEKRLQK